MNNEARISLLYAEDDPQARELLEKLIRHKFPTLILYVAADGQQGIDLYLKHRPELVLTDITMPVLDGIELTKRIRALDPDAVIMALTAYSDAEWQNKSRDLRFNHCITKPVDFKVLLCALEDAIRCLQAGPP